MVLTGKAYEEGILSKWEERGREGKGTAKKKFWRVIHSALG